VGRSEENARLIEALEAELQALTDSK